MAALAHLSLGLAGLLALLDRAGVFLVLSGDGVVLERSLPAPALGAVVVGACLAGGVDHLRGRGSRWTWVPVGLVLVGLVVVAAERVRADAEETVNFAFVASAAASGRQLAGALALGLVAGLVLPAAVRRARTPG